MQTGARTNGQTVPVPPTTSLSKSCKAAVLMSSPPYWGCPAFSATNRSCKTYFFAMSTKSTITRLMNLCSRANSNLAYLCWSAQQKLPASSFLMAAGFCPAFEIINNVESKTVAAKQFKQGSLCVSAKGKQHCASYKRFS